MDPVSLPELKWYTPYTRLRSDERDQFARDLRVHYDNGASLRELERKSGLSYQTVSRLLRSCGTVLREPNGGTRPRLSTS
jgi:hypothetical protein